MKARNDYLSYPIDLRWLVSDFIFICRLVTGSYPESKPCPVGLIVFQFFLNVYLFLRESKKEHEQERKQRERKTQNLKQAPGSELSAQSPIRGSNSWTVIMTSSEVRHLTD